MAEAATKSSVRTRAPSASAPGFGNTFASEWTKMISVRSSWLALGVGVALAIGFTALICGVFGANYDSLEPNQQADFDPATISMFGTLFMSICFAVLGVNLVTGEYSSGMIRLTLATTPRRTRVLAAKILTIVIVTLVAGLFTNLVMFFAGNAILEATGTPSASIGDDGVMRMLIGLTLMTPVFPVFGAMLGFVFRGTGASITAIQALIFGPGIFGGILPNWWQEHFIAFLPGNASDSLTMGQFNRDSLSYADPPIAFIALLAWIVVFVALGWWSLTRRDA